MAKIVQRRRGTTAQHSSFTGDIGEITVDLTDKTLRVHDGSTVTGVPLAKADMTTVTDKIPLLQTNANSVYINTIIIILNKTILMINNIYISVIIFFI